MSKTPHRDPFTLVPSTKSRQTSTVKDAIVTTEAVLRQPSASMGAMGSAVLSLRLALAKASPLGPLTTVSHLLDTSLLPRLTALVSSYLDACCAATAAAGGGTEGGGPYPTPTPSAAAAAATTTTTTSTTLTSSLASPVPVDLAMDCFWVLTNLAAGDSATTRLLVKHGVVALSVRAVREAAHDQAIVDAVWTLSNIAGDGNANRTEVYHAKGMTAIAVRTACELGMLGYFPFGTGHRDLVGEEGVGDGVHAATLPSSSSSTSSSTNPTSPAAPTLVLSPGGPSSSSSSSSSSGSSPGAVVPPSPLHTSDVLRICTWALRNLCEGDGSIEAEKIESPNLVSALLLPVLNAALDCPDIEVLAQTCDALSFLCETAADTIQRVLSILKVLVPPSALSGSGGGKRPRPVDTPPSLSSPTFSIAVPWSEAALGEWDVAAYYPGYDAGVVGKKSLPAPTPNSLAEVWRGGWGYRCPPTAGGGPGLPATAAKLARLLRHTNLRVAKPALRCVGNIVCADDEKDFTQAVCDMRSLGLLRRLMEHNTREIVKEACWTMSNVAAGTTAQIGEVLACGCLPRVVALCNGEAGVGGGVGNGGVVEAGVRTEACWIILNSTSCGSDSQIETLVRAGAVKVLCYLLSDTAMCQMALEGLEKVFHACERRVTAAMAASGGGDTKAGGGRAPPPPPPPPPLLLLPPLPPPPPLPPCLV